MKKRKTKHFEKHELFKVVGIFMLIAALLTWVIEIGVYQGGQFSNEEMIRIGVSDFFTYSIFGHYYYPTHFIILFVAAGFYKFLGIIPAYQKLTDNIAKRFKNVPALFAIIAMVLLAAFAGVSTEYFVAIALIPFFITILSKLNVHKVVGVASTFGGVLIGILSASYSEKVVGELANSTTGIGIQYGYQRIPLLIIFGVSLLLLAFFIWRKCKNKVAEEDMLKDPFASNVLEGKNPKAVKRIKTAPMAILLFIILGVLVLGFIPWEERFDITLFSDLHEDITTAVLFGTTIFSYILGNIVTALGSWDLISASVSLIVAAFVLKLIYSISFDKMIDEFVEGFKMAVPTMGIMLMVFAMGLFTAAYPVVANAVNFILSKGTDVLYVFGSGIVSTLFSPDFNMALRYTASAYTSIDNINNVGLALQSGFGFVSLIAPSSLMLMTGLSMLKVKYSEWFKFIWKFLLLVLILIIAVLLTL